MPLHPNGIIDGATFNQQTMLLVEDIEDDVLIMQTAFQSAKLPNPLQVVNDGERAIAYLKGEGTYADRKRYPLPVVILLDLNMPKMNGFEVLEWLRAQPVLKRISVYILTSSARSLDVERAFDLGANSYLVKPGKFDELVQLLKTLHGYARFAAFPVLG